MEIHYRVNTAGSLITILLTNVCLPTQKFCVKILCKYTISSQRYKHVSENMQIVIQ